MEKIAKLYDEINKEVDKFNVPDISDHLTLIGSGQLSEIFDSTGRPNRYYQWLHCFVKSKKPRQIVELGAAAGISTILMATANKKSKIISVDCDPQAWNWMNREYPNVTKVMGDDLDLSIYPDGIDLDKTDLWFFDSLHTRRQLQSEIDLYDPFFHKGTVLLFDDIHINQGMEDVWDLLQCEKLDVSDKLHYTGFGIAIV